MQPRRTLHLIDTGGPGGAETVFLELVRRLPDLGWDALPVVPEEDWLASALRDVGLSPTVLVSEGRFDTRYARALRRTLRRERIELVQAHLFGTSVYGTLAAMGTGIPVVCTFHGHPDISPTDRLKAIKLGLLRLGDSRIVCVSESLRDHFRSIGAFTGPVTVIPNGIDTELFAPGLDSALRAELGVPPGAPIVGAVGNVRASKDYPTLLRAFRIVRDTVPEARLVVAGQASGSMFDALIALAWKLDIAEATRFVGFRDDVAGFLKALDVFTLSSSDEGFSLSTVQAMATGLPVVATRCGGPEQIVGDSGGAELVPPRDPAALARAILRVLADPDHAKRLGTAGRRRAVADYSVEGMVRSYVELYERCLS